MNVTLQYHCVGFLPYISIDISYAPTLLRPHPLPRSGFEILESYYAVLLSLEFTLCSNSFLLSNLNFVVFSSCLNSVFLSFSSSIFPFSPYSFGPFILFSSLLFYLKVYFSLSLSLSSVIQMLHNYLSSASTARGKGSCSIPSQELKYECCAVQQK